MRKPKLIRITTVSSSLIGLLEGQLRFMGEHFEVVGISSPDNKNFHEILEKREKIRMLEVEMTRKITPFKDIKAVFQLYRIFKREKPLIVHSHTPKAGTLGMIAAYLAGVQYRLHTIAGLPLVEARGSKRKLLDIVEKITYKCATKIYPNSNGLKQIILDNNYTSEKKLRVIGNGSSNGIDLNHFDPKLYDQNFKDSLRESLGISKEDFVYLFVGRIVTDKGINELITAFERTNKKHEKTKLILVGPFEKDLDPILPETEKLIHSHPNIIYVGFQSDVRPYFAISNVFTFPSYREGFPNVVMQAGAMGIPTIASNINGCNEIIIEGENGNLVPVKDENTLQEKMEWFAASGDKPTYNAGQIRELIFSRFSRPKIWNEILEEYSSL